LQNPIRISSEVIAVSGRRIARDRYEIPEGWKGIESSGL